MGFLSIRKYGDPVLREKCQPVSEIGNTIEQLIDDMAKVMYQHGGIGLAAPQVGVKKRVIVVDVDQKLMVFTNPEILSREGKETALEGCLSIPDVAVEVERSTRITVEGFNRIGGHVELTLDGLTARAVQHEIDHLNGILIIDYLSFVKRQLIKKQLQSIASHG